jgi:hypothetical protein
MFGLKHCIGLCGLVLALPAASLPPAPELPPTSHQHLLEPVRSIESAHQIKDWEHLDDRHVVLHLGPQDQYLVTLKSRCLGLNWARNVGVTMSNNTIWAGFDAITADGNHCKIERINPVGSP